MYAVTAVMPSLNEEKNLLSAVNNVIASCDRLGVNCEIVIVNDGSSDDTGKLAESLKAQHPFIQVIHHDSPQGIGGSFWDGVKIARGDVVVMIPGDGENDAAEIMRYLPLMNHVDLVVPYVFNRQVRSLARRILSNLYRGIINLSFGTTLNYMNGTVLYRKCILDDIELMSKGFFYQTELLIKCIRRGYLFAEVPYALLQRAAGMSKATSMRSLKNVAKSYFILLKDVYFGPLQNKALAPESITALRRKEAGYS